MWLLIAEAFGAQNQVPFEELLAAAEKGDVAAQYLVAQRYGQGEGVARDSERAMQWLRSAAESGHLEAQAGLGILLTRPGQTDADREAGMPWLQRAAERRHQGAALTLGALAVDAGDPTLALHWFRVAADTDDRSLQLALSDMLQKGEGVKRNEAEAYYWMRMAVRHDPPEDHENSALAQRLDAGTRAEIDARVAAWRPKRSSSEAAEKAAYEAKRVSNEPADAVDSGATGYIQMRYWDFPDEGVDAPPVPYFERWTVRDAIAFRGRKPQMWEGRAYIEVEFSDSYIERAGLAETLRETGRGEIRPNLTLSFDPDGTLLGGLVAHSNGYHEIEADAVESTLRFKAKSVRGKLRVRTPESGPGAMDYRFEISVDATMIQVAPPAESARDQRQ